MQFIEKYAYVTLRRYIELLVLTVALSVLTSLIGLLGSLETLKKFLFFFILIFAVVNIFLLRQCFRDLHRAKRYYISNFIACTLFAFTSIVLYLLLPSGIYAWIFGITKALKYSNLQISSSWAVLCFHAAIFLITAIAPVDYFIFRFRHK